MSERAKFSERRIEVVERPGGAWLMRSAIPLEPYPNDLGTILKGHAGTSPDRAFLAERRDAGWRTISYAETFASVQALASAFLDLGLGPQTPVAILSENSIAHALVSLASMYAGIPVAPISPIYSTGFGDLRRLRFVLDALQPSLVFAADADVYRDALGAADATFTLIGRGSLAGRQTLLLDDLLRTPVTPAVDAAYARITPDDIAKILFTSGSTGEPKGVLNTHRMLCSNQQSLAQLWPFLGQHELVLVDWLPWHHTFGGNHNFNMVLFHGGTLFIDDGRPMPGRFERSIENLRDVPPTVYFNVPRGHKLLADALVADADLARRFFSRLELIGNAAAALPRTTWSALTQLAANATDRAIPVTGEWGATETAPMVTAVHYPLEDPADIGLPGPGSELLFVPSDHKIEVRVRGPQVTPGYWRRPDLTRDAFDDDGFYRIGDAVRFADPADPSRGLLFDGRIAENFKLSSGTWVDAGAVRLGVLAAAAPLVDEVVVAGADRDAVAVLLFANARACDALGDASTVRARLETALAAYNETVHGSSGRVASAVIATEPLSPADGELTDKGSVNQRRVLERRAAVVERLFRDPLDADAIVPRGINSGRTVNAINAAVTVE